MSGRIDWTKDKRRQRTTNERAETAYEDARDFAHAQLRRDQARAAKLIRAHPEEPRFKWMARWIDAGKFLGKDHVASVYKIAADRGWRMPTADGFVPHPVFANYGQPSGDDVAMAIQYLKQYQGKISSLLRMKERAANSAWRPSVTELSRIMSLAGGCDPG